MNCKICEELLAPSPHGWSTNICQDCIETKIKEPEKEEMKPCPFCGGKAEMNTGGFGEKFVTCASENCGGRLGTGIWFKDEWKAIQVWNQRQ